MGIRFGPWRFPVQDSHLDPAPGGISNQGIRDENNHGVALALRRFIVYGLRFDVGGLQWRRRGFGR